ncbi:MAG: carboxypeptidase regulatory-like domain-containing protein [Rhodospirillales bacterium]|jgi:Fe-S-cluster-containing dehydrogenase component|nr:carboxypeptidase regulatory-like domain-containing protein [Rhodospirillales bacterium]MDP6645872.1 carboxypeptidase regulatory-like domain-containing protein [Rhodospirillales bacterium]|tara:strand:- start:2609 stop:3457 length:849 start_codon:yes stop_codon:yes gene_type:complete
MTQWNLIVDVANCTNCSVCTLASQDEHVGNQFPGYADEMPLHGHHWIEIQRRERGSVPIVDVAYVPTMCQHCDDAPCIAAAEGGAVNKRPDGIVIIDPDKAKGQQKIVDACPYGAVWWNQEKQLPQHWIFDAHLLDAGWKEPRCQNVCATNVFRSMKVDDAEMKRIVEQEGLEELRPDLATKPRVYYKNLWRYTKCFIAGSVASETGGIVDCVEGAKVTLSRNGETLGEAESDGFGEFKIDRLDPDSGSYNVEIAMSGYASRTIPVELGQSTYIGEVMMQQG